MLAARDLPDGPVVKQLLDWIAELRNWKIADHTKE